jgi:hypothetical protein
MVVKMDGIPEQAAIPNGDRSEAGDSDIPIEIVAVPHGQFPLVDLQKTASFKYIIRSKGASPTFRDGHAAP